MWPSLGKSCWILLTAKRATCFMRPNYIYTSYASKDWWYKAIVEVVSDSESSIFLWRVYSSALRSLLRHVAMDKIVLENLHLSHFSSNWSHLKQFNQAAWNHRVTGALFSNFQHRNDMWVGWKSWSDLFCEGWWLVTLNLAHISPAQILDTDCVPKCHMSSHKLLILTGIPSVLWVTSWLIPQKVLILLWTPGVMATPWGDYAHKQHHCFLSITGTTVVISAIPVPPAWLRVKKKNSALHV